MFNAKPSEVKAYLLDQLSSNKLLEFNKEIYKRGVVYHYIAIKLDKIIIRKFMLTMFNKKSQNNKKSVVYTTTREAFMPVRLYYKIHNQHLLIKALRKLKCVAFGDDKRFILAYYKEAKNLPLAVHYQDVPEGLYPITLAEGYIK